MDNIPRKRNRRNAIRPNSQEADAMRDLALRYHMNGVRIAEPTAGNEASTILDNTDAEESVGTQPSSGKRSRTAVHLNAGENLVRGVNNGSEVASVGALLPMPPLPRPTFDAESHSSSVADERMSSNANLLALSNGDPSVLGDRGREAGGESDTDSSEDDRDKTSQDASQESKTDADSTQQNILFLQPEQDEEQEDEQGQIPSENVHNLEEPNETVW